jgi:hypothetical protein
MFIIGTNCGVVVGSISCELALSTTSQSNTPKMVKKKQKKKSVTDYNDLKPKFDLISVGFFLKKKK